MTILTFFLLTFLASNGLSQTPKAIYPGPAKLEQLCIVITGSKKDPNGFLDEELFKSGQSIAGEDCKVFDDWESATTFAKNNLKPEGKLLVVQGAHGNQNGSYNVNNGDPISAENVFKHLKDLSTQFHVGSVIHSCYSAEILNYKLLDDENENSRLDKLCLVSSSSFRRLTFSRLGDDIIQRLLEMKPGESLESPFLQHHSGLISSAAWSEVGLPSFLMSKSTHDGYQTMLNMDRILRGEAQCNNIALANMSLCLSPGITDQTYEDVMAFMDPRVKEEYKGFFEANVGRQVKKFKDRLFKNPNDMVAFHGLPCKEGILNTYRERFGEKLIDLKNHIQVMYIQDEIKKKAFYKDHCQRYSQLIDDEWERESLLAESFHNGVKAYLESLSRLERKYTKRKFDDNFDLFEFANAAFGEKKVCTPEEQKKLIQSKEGIIQSLFGMNFFTDEYASTYEADLFGADEMTVDRPVSTQVVLKGFQNADLLREYVANPKDQQRRKACREFKFN